MKLLLIFAAALASAHALQLQYILQGSAESSEEKYRLVLPPSGQRGYAVLDQPNDDSSESSAEEYHVLVPAIGERHPNLAGVPIFQTVKVNVPRYGDASIKQQLLAQALAARGINLQNLGGVGPLTKSTDNLGGGVQDLGAQLLARSVPNLSAKHLGAQLLGRSNLGGVQDLGAQILTRSAPNYGVQDLGAQLLGRSNLGGVQDLGAQLLTRSSPNLAESQVLLIRQQRQAPATVPPTTEKEGGTVADEVESPVMTEVPAAGDVTKAPIVDAVVPPVLSPVISPVMSSVPAATKFN